MHTTEYHIFIVIEWMRFLEGTLTGYWQWFRIYPLEKNLETLHTNFELDDKDGIHTLLIYTQHKWIHKNDRFKVQQSLLNSEYFNRWPIQPDNHVSKLKFDFHGEIISTVWSYLKFWSETDIFYIWACKIQ